MTTFNKNVIPVQNNILQLSKADTDYVEQSENTWVIV